MRIENTAEASKPPLPKPGPPFALDGDKDWSA